MSFNIFQTDTAVFKKVSVDGTGSPIVQDQIVVNIDPNFGFTQTINESGERVNGHTSYISGNALGSFWDGSHQGYVIAYNGKEWGVREVAPQYKIGTNNLDHLKVKLT